MCGFGARRKCEEIILSGRVTVNHQIVRNLATQVDLANDLVQVDTEAVQLQEKQVYLLLNKPKGYLTAVSDARGRKTVRDLIQMKLQIFPVGRLDFDTTGALLLTNDGNLAYRLVHPKFKIAKEYTAYLSHAVRREDIEKLQTGIQLDDGPTAPCRARVLHNPKYVRLVLHEGRNRQVKRMFEALGYRVKSLNRDSFAGLDTTGLDFGKWRFLSASEIQLLFKMTGSNQ
jgi:pseudouridine synthase